MLRFVFIYVFENSGFSVYTVVSNLISNYVLLIGLIQYSRLFIDVGENECDAIWQQFIRDERVYNIIDSVLEL